MSIRISIAVSCVAILTACATDPNSEAQRTAPGATGADGEGWHCYGAPSPFYNPGWVFSVSRDNVRVDETDLKSSLPPGNFREAPGASTSFTTDTKWNLGIAASILKLQGIADVNAAARAGQFHKVTIKISDRVDETSFGEVQAAAQNWANASGTSIDLSRKYYVVRKAIAAKTYEYTLDSAWGAALGGGVSVPKFDASAGGRMTCAGTADGDATPIEKCIVGAGNATTYQIKQTFDRPLRVCIVALELPIKRRPGLGEVGYVVEQPKQVPVDSVLWTSSTGGTQH